MIAQKDFKAIAEIISDTTLTTMRSGSKTIQETSMAQRACMRGGLDVGKNWISQKLADYFATQNPKFDRERFLKACGL